MRHAAHERKQPVLGIAELFLPGSMQQDDLFLLQRLDQIIHTLMKTGFHAVGAVRRPVSNRAACARIARRAPLVGIMPGNGLRVEKR